MPYLAMILALPPQSMVWYLDSVIFVVALFLLKITDKLSATIQNYPKHQQEKKPMPTTAAVRVCLSQHLCVSIFIFGIFPTIKFITFFCPCCSSNEQSEKKKKKIGKNGFPFLVNTPNQPKSKIQIE